MSNYNFRWKGYPNRHLPRIRLAPTATSNTQKAHAAAENVVRVPFGLALEKARLRVQQAYKIRRRRKRSSQASTAASYTSRRRVSLQIVHDEEAHGWDGSRVNVASTPRKGNEGQDFQHRLSINQISSTRSTQVPDLTDGARCSIIRARTPARQDTRYSLMQIHTPYFGDLPKHDDYNKTDHRRLGEYAHVATIDSVSKRKTDPWLSKPERSPVYDFRLPTKPLGTQDPKRTAKSRRGPSTHSKRSNIPSKKTHKAKGLHAFRRDVGRKVSLTASTAKSIVLGAPSNVLTDLPLGSVVRQKALDSFQRGLEKHLIAHEALRAASLATTTTPSCVSASAHTIIEFIPYVDEFRAGGLAVTSSDQRDHSRYRVKNLPAPPTPQKDFRYIKKTPRMPWIGEAGTEGGDPQEECSTASDTVSSCTTVIAFPPLMTPPPSDRLARKALPPPKKPAKMSLPWLRKAKEIPCIFEDDDRPMSATGATSDPSPRKVINQDKGKGRASEVEPNLRSERRGEIKWIHPNYSSSSTNPANLEITLSDTCLKPRRRPRPSQAQLNPPNKLLPSSLSSRPKSRISRARAAQKLPLQHVHHSSMSHGPSSSSIEEESDCCAPPASLSVVENSSQRSISSLPRGSVSESYSHYDFSVFKETLHETIKAFNNPEWQLVGTKISAGLDMGSKTPLIDTDPVKRTPAMPWRPLSRRRSEPVSSSKMILSPSAMTWETMSSEQVVISDRNVLKGLQVALAAVCDEQVDHYIEETSGRSVRRILAKLSLLDPLGVNELAAVARRTALEKGEELGAMGLKLDEEIVKEFCSSGKKPKGKR